MKISKHLTFEECTKSSTADKLKIVNNNPNLSTIENMKLLAEKVFEPMREHFNVPIYISSMYRGLPLNSAIGGSLKSQHCSGQAMDIDMGEKGKPSNKDLFDYIKKNLVFDQLIWEFGTDKNPSWIHVSYSSVKNRKQILKAKKNNLGKTYYENF
jgi:zinc D-Ala-D-Ala carboxypeptidase